MEINRHTFSMFPNDAVNHGEADIQIEFEQFNVDGSQTAKIKMVLSISYWYKNYVCLSIGLF